MSRFGTVFLVLFGLVAGVQVHAQTYKVVGADGRVTFTDRPPAEPSSRVSEVRLPAQSAPVEANVAAKPPRETVTYRPTEERRSSLVMYSTEWCGYCTKARSYMSSKGIPYKEIDIEKDADGKSEHARLGGRGVPFFVAGRVTMSGFSESRFNDFLRGVGR